MIFLKWKKKYHLFDLKTDDGVYVWDLFRYEIFELYKFPEIRIINGRNTINSMKAIVSVMTILFSSVFSFFFKKSDVLVFSYSRYLNDEGFLYDKASQNFIEELDSNILIVERLKILKKYKNKAEYNFSNFFGRFICHNQYLSQDCFEKIDIALTHTFGISKISYPYLNNLFIQFQKDFHYYVFLFSIKKD